MEVRNRVEIVSNFLDVFIPKVTTNTETLSFINYVLNVNPNVFVSDTNLEELDKKIKSDSKGRYLILDYISKIIATIKSTHIGDVLVIDIIDTYIQHYLETMHSVFKEQDSIFYGKDIYKNISMVEYIKVLYFINLTFNGKLNTIKNK